MNGAGENQALVLSDGTSLTWDQLILDFAPRLISYARSRGIREPEDLVQDVFVAAVECLGGFEGDRAALRSLLFTIAYRRIADEHRRGYRHPETLVADHSAVPDPGPSIDEVVDLHMEARLAMDAFSVLDGREQRVLEMRLLDEATPAEVAKALGLSSGNVRVIQARALVKVRRHLQTTLGRGSTISVPALGIPFEIVRYLRDQPARRGLLGEWVEWFRASPRPAALPTGSAGDERTIVDLLSRTGETGHMMSSLADGAGPAVAKIGALATVLALAAGAGGHWIIEEEELPSVNGSIVEEAEPAAAPRDVDLLIGPEVTGARGVGRVSDPALPAGPEAGDRDEARDRPPSPETETLVTNPSTPDPGQDPVDNLVDSAVEPVVEEALGLVEDTGAVVEDTVAVVEDTVAVVEEVAETAVEEVVIPVVEDTVDVVEDVTTPPVEETGGPILGQVEEALDDDGGVLGGLLGLS